jgi:hypothetical protein
MVSVLLGQYGPNTVVRRHGNTDLRHQKRVGIMERLSKGKGIIRPTVFCGQGKLGVGNLTRQPGATDVSRALRDSSVH